MDECNHYEEERRAAEKAVADAAARVSLYPRDWLELVRNCAADFIAADEVQHQSRHELKHRLKLLLRMHPAPQYIDPDTKNL